MTNYPPRLTFNDKVMFEGVEHEIVAFSSNATYSEPVVHLRTAEGTTTIVPLALIYADLAGALPTVIDHAAKRLVKKRRQDRRAELKQPVTYLGTPFVHEEVPPDGPPELVDPNPEDLVPYSMFGLDTAAALEALPARALKRALKLEAHLLEMSTGYRSGSADDARPGEPKPQYDPKRTTLTARREAKAKELHCTLRTILRQHKALQEEGLWGVVDGNATRAINPLNGLDKRIIKAVLAQGLIEADLSTGTFDRFYRRIQDGLTEEFGPDAPALPEKKTFRKQVAILLRRRHMFGTAKTRHSVASSPQRSYKHMHTSRPGQVVLFDSTPLDVRTYDAHNDVTQGVTLCAAVDLHTRSILAWRIVPLAEKTVDAILLLLDILRPEPMRPLWDKELGVKLLGIPHDTLINHDARFACAAAKPVIYPEAIIIDNAPVYASAAFTRACRFLGVGVTPARVRQPTDKPHIESYFKRVGYDFNQHLAGHKGRTTVERGKVSEEQARWSIEQIEELFAEYIVTIYQRTPHSALRVHGDPNLRLTPNEAYAAAIQRCGWIPAPVDDTLYYELLPTKWAVLNSYGFNIDNKVYNDPILYEYQTKISPISPPLTAKGRRQGRETGTRRKGSLWPIHVDDRNQLFAYFQAPDHGGRWYALRWAAAPPELEPFSNILFETGHAVVGDLFTRQATQRAIARFIFNFQRSLDAPENYTKKDRRARARESDRTRAALRDQAAAAELANSEVTKVQRSIRPSRPDQGTERKLDLRTVPKLETARTKAPA